MKLHMKKAIILCLLFAPIFHITTATAGNAVSETNGKVDVTAGTVDGNDILAAAASISFPVSSNLGIQFDGLAGEIDPDSIYGVGTHFFWRDSKSALLGLTASWSETENIEIIRTGLEGEYYLNNITFSLLAGYQSGDIEDSEYWSFDVGYYLLDDLLLSAGYGMNDSMDIYGAELEYQTKYSGLSVFASAYGGEDNYDHYFGGIRYYWGSKKPLIRRHREDDPKNNLIQDISENIINIISAQKVAAGCPTTTTSIPSTRGVLVISGDARLRSATCY